MSRRSFEARSSEKRDRRRVRLDERGALVADEWRTRGRSGEEVVGDGALDAGPLGQDERLAQAVVEREDQQR